MSFTIEGGRDLAAALEQFARPMAKAVGRRALKRAADPILSAYQANTTVKTGNLQRSEVVGTKLTRRQAQANRKLESASAVEVHVGTSDPAGVQEEFGNVHQAANPALRPAWDAEGGQRAVDRIAAELAADIEKTAARVARKAARNGA